MDPINEGFSPENGALGTPKDRLDATRDALDPEKEGNDLVPPWPPEMEISSQIEGSGHSSGGFQV